MKHITLFISFELLSERNMHASHKNYFGNAGVYAITVHSKSMIKN